MRAQTAKKAARIRPCRAGDNPPSGKAAGLFAPSLMLTPRLRSGPTVQLSKIASGDFIAALLPPYRVTHSVLKPNSVIANQPGDRVCYLLPCRHQAGKACSTRGDGYAIDPLIVDSDFNRV